jgi:hypothetical protein
MPTETKHDPIEREQSQNPVGPAQKANNATTVSEPPATAAGGLEATRPAKTIAIKIICLFACMAVGGSLIAWKLHRSKTGLEAGAQPATWLHAPGVVATDEELAQPWSSKQFTYRDPIMGRDVPAMVVRLPDGGYWGFSLVDPIGSCQLEYVTDLDRLQSFYHFRTDHPMVGNPCNLALFDLLQYGGLPGAEVRGAPVNGMGVRPPIAIEIEQTGKAISATKIE